MNAQAGMTGNTPGGNTPGGKTSGGGNWSDLRTRVISALLMLVVGIGEVWLGGTPFLLLVLVLTGVMVWELVRMSAPVSASALGTLVPPQHLPLVLGGFAALCLWGAVGLHANLAPALLILPGFALALSERRDRQIAAIYAIAIMVAGFGLIDLRNAGMPAILWLVMVVIASDVAGYFAGRALGGPKFWPAISPKKTWSGTVAGWIGAVLVSAVFALLGYAPWSVVLLAPFVAFAGQMGDIAESWIKRRAGVKDSSGLIPGHGGFLDRFDALIGAVVLVMLLALITALPLPHAIAAATGG